jgi:hypothetical protein
MDYSSGVSARGWTDIVLFYRQAVAVPSHRVLIFLNLCF